MIRHWFGPLNRLPLTRTLTFRQFCERSTMPHDNNIFCELIPGILKGNRAHHVEIETIALKQIKPFQIDMDGYPSFQHQQLLGVSPPAPWAVLNARTTG